MIDDIETYTTGHYASLGPHYKLSRDFAERALSGEYDLSDVIEKAADEFRCRLTTMIQDSVMSDVECNIQAEIWREVDEIVTAILGGKQWALQRHVLGDRYECAKIRATIASMVPKELQDARVAELEAENKRLAEDLERERRHR